MTQNDTKEAPELHMNLKAQLSRAFFFSLLFAAGFGLIVLLMMDQGIDRFDLRIISFIQSYESPGLTEVMSFFTFLGSGIMITVTAVLAAVVLYKGLGHRIELIVLGAAVGGASIMNLALKAVFHRTRPNIHRLIEIGGYSFPSGHSMAAAALYGSLAFLLWRHMTTSWGRKALIGASVVMIIGIGLSRIYLGVHYPSDVIGGYLASGFWLAVLIWVFQRYAEKNS